MQVLAVVVAVAALLLAGAASSADARASDFEPRYALEPPQTIAAARASLWRQVREARADQRVRLYVALKLRNTAALESTLYAVSTPSSPRYGAHLTRRQLADLVAPEPRAVHQVCRWLAHLNATHYDSERWRRRSNNDEFDEMPRCGALQDTVFTHDWIVVDTTVDIASAMLGARLFEFQHELVHSWRIVRTLEYRVPSHIASLIDIVAGISHFPSKLGSLRARRAFQQHQQQQQQEQQRLGPKLAMQRQRAAEATSTAPPSNQIVTPAVLRKHYNITVTSGIMANNSQGVHEFEEQWYSESDLSLFLQRNALPNATVAVQVGFNNVSRPGGEAELDLQYIMGVGVNVPTWFVYVPGVNPRNQEEPFLEWILLMLQLPHAPWINSISYGESERSYSGAYLTRVAAELQKFGVLGHSLLFSSGDYGVGCDCSQPNQTQYVAHFPSSSPYVTSVGATTAAYDLAGNPTNVEVGIPFSGGGFSTHFARPSYQNDAVTRFLSTSPLPPASFFNASNRGYVDVCAYGWNYEIIENGNPDYIGGTSASTPAVAGMFALMNDQRLKAGKAPLGFLNPLIYQTYANNQQQPNPPFLHIAQGNNGDTPCCIGFFASTQPGWSPIGGVGSINFAALNAITLAAP